MSIIDSGSGFSSSGFDITVTTTTSGLNESSPSVQPTKGDSTFANLKQSAQHYLKNPDQIKTQLRQGADTAQKQIQHYAKFATDYTRQNPFYVALGTMGVGMILGAILSRRRVY